MEDPEYSFYLGLSIILFLDHDRGVKISNIQDSPQEVAVKWAFHLQWSWRIPNIWNWTAKCVLDREIKLIKHFFCGDL